MPARFPNAFNFQSLRGCCAASFLRDASAYARAITPVASPIVCVCVFFKSYACLVQKYTTIVKCLYKVSAYTPP